MEVEMKMNGKIGIGLRREIVSWVCFIYSLGTLHAARCSVFGVGGRWSARCRVIWEDISGTRYIYMEGSRQGYDGASCIVNRIPN